MLVLGLQGSPRKRGNTEYLLSSFMDAAETLGAKTKTIHVSKKNIQPCLGCGYCEKNGFCIIKNDDMKSQIYPLIREADVVVAATPIYFYNTSTQLKGLIDRCQSFWSRKYKFKLDDPKRNYRQGVMLAQGATKGDNLFDGIKLTMKYFFDAIGATYTQNLTYQQKEKPGDMKKHPRVLEDVTQTAQSVLIPFSEKKKILFACSENACRSQMASAFAQYNGGDKIEAFSAGSTPVETLNPIMEEVMAEKGIDMAFRTPRSIEDAVSNIKPDMIVTMGCGEECPFVPGVQRSDWELPDPAGKPLEFMRSVRDDIENRINRLLNISK